MPYCTRANVEATFGTNNVADYASLDSADDAAKITVRITRAILVASEEIDAWLRGTQYKLPLANADGDTPTVIEDVCAQLAGVWLYEARGTKDVRDGKPYHRLSWNRTNSRRILNHIRERRMIIDAVEG